ncbi:tRNA pseudouridine(38-40) synthase TruA [Tepidibacter aestuarii]|uniref:tRNA pseudouridine(38-40) synthase TruA n=1 Tax=Tepidibacter aestuarii TaxID=2925782 RepID=UPI0020BEC201|nr:tRNA pseudouridine(38-40) synthase TruA [Tepidibacter aestuarii]CAH2213644.1 tRNA pseudouridine synthase A 1, Isomerase [Tepidibacter aestuarii]CAH2215650.1 tRNA pseudouridine synthase A 1, Isomerase [Tepidibacter aestuarii]
MRNIKITIKYDGSKYKGWQRLKTTDSTIQAKIEAVVSKMLDEKIEIIGSGRTDAGVHAIAQIANFKTNSQMNISKMHEYLYNYLPQDIVISNIEEVDVRFHSRYNAVSKTYLYKVDNNKIHDPFLRKYTTHIPDKLNIDNMKRACKHLIGEHDFSSFKSSKSKKKSSIRTINYIDIEIENGFIDIKINGNGFLHNMVRIIVGTLIDIGHGQINPDYIKDILESKDRSLAGSTAYSQGLYLYKVNYKEVM